MGKMPWTRSRSNGSRLQTGLVPRRRSRRLKKRVHFKKDESLKSTMMFKCAAARSLFVVKSILDLPNELTTKILTYFDAAELMTLRCVNHHFKTLIDETSGLWTNASYHNMWPTSSGDKALFQRGADNGNVESLTKLGLSHLYHYNLTVGEEKNKKDVDIHSVMAANYLHNLDTNISPKKPLTWMLIRPPWSQSRSICLKHLVHTQMLKFKEDNPDGTVFYNLGRVFNLETEDVGNKQKVHEHYIRSSDCNNSFARLELLTKQKNAIVSDAGKRLQWLRELKECAVSGNVEAKFELINWMMSFRHNNNDFFNTTELSQQLFKSGECSCVDKLEQYQPKINSLMRCILIDWLAEVAYMKDMSHQVLHAAVSYVDRYLMSRVVERTKLQLLGITCVLLAAKSHYDTRMVHLLTVRESSWLTDQTYQYEDVVKMMGEIIGAFRGDLWKPTSWNYLNILLSSPKIDDTWKAYSHYLHDISLQFTSFGSFKPSMLACATVFLSGIVLNRDEPWPKEFVELTGFTVKDIANCAALMHYKSFTCPSMKDDRNLPLESITVHYRTPQHYGVSSMQALTEAEIRSRILAADSTLSCVSQEPLHFDVITTCEVDETFNLSIKSVDYDGDSEESLDSESDLDESFCVGRSRMSSYHSVEEFSDDETTMDGGNYHFNNQGSAANVRETETFTPIFHASNDHQNVFFDEDGQATGFHGQYLQPCPFGDSVEAATGTKKRAAVDGLAGTDKGKQRLVRSKNQKLRHDPVGKRTRSKFSSR